MEMWPESDFWVARFVKKAASTADSGEAFEKRKSGLGSLLEICLFQYRTSEAFTENGFSLGINEFFLICAFVCANE